MTAWRRPAVAALLLLASALAACQSSPVSDLATIDRAQSSDENISSLSAVIDRNPRDPEAYNVRGSAYGRGGKYREALRDFDKAIERRAEISRASAYRYRDKALAAIAMGLERDRVPL